MGLLFREFFAAMAIPWEADRAGVTEPVAKEVAARYPSARVFLFAFKSVDGLDVFAQN